MSGSLTGRKRILLVEDDDAIRQLIADVLVDAGYDVDAAPGGYAGVERAKKRPPDLILLDKLMPEGDGNVFVRGYKGEAPIVVISAARDGGEWARQIGAAAYILKPFELEHLLATVEAHLSRRSPRPVAQGA